MPRFLPTIIGAEHKDVQQLNRYEGFDERVAVGLRYQRGTAKPDMPIIEKANAPDRDRSRSEPSNTMQRDKR